MGRITKHAAKMIQLRALRHETQIDFARLLSVTQQQVSKWENGDQELPVWTLVKLAKLSTAISSEFVRYFHAAVGLPAIEPVEGPFADEPVGGEPASLKGLSKSVEEFWARHGALPPVEPVTGEGKSPAPVKKAKGQRRKKM